MTAVGDGPAVRALERAPGTTVECAADAAAVGESADCVLVTPTVDVPAVVTALRERDLTASVVACVADAAEARAVKSAGATEFFRTPDDGDDGWDLLATRVTAVVGRARDAGTRAAHEALHEMHEAVSDPTAEFEERVERLLAVGRRRLGVADAHLSWVDRETDTQRLVATSADGDMLTAGEEYEHSGLYCRRTVETDDLVAIPDARQGWADDRAYEETGLRCYLGGRVTVDGEVFGTLCFVDEAAREPFTADERALVEVMVDWVGTEVARHRSRTRLDDVLDRMEDAFFAVDRDWEVTYANEGGRAVLAEAMGIDPDDEIVGRHLWESIPGAAETPFYEHYTRAMETQEPVTFDAEYEPLGVHFDVRAHPSETGLSVYFSDVTDRVEREEELRVRTRAMEEADVALTLVDPHAEDEPIVWANEGFEEVTGYDREAVVGRNCRFMQGAETDPETVAELRAAIDAEESTEVVIRNYRADGTPFWNRLELTPIFDEDGDLLRYLGSQNDVTEEIERERRMRALLDLQRSIGRADGPGDLFDRLEEADVAALGLGGFGVRRYDPETDRLEPAAVTGTTMSRADRLAAGPESPQYRALERGEPVVDTVTDPDPYGREAFEEVVYVPLGEYGVVSATGADGRVDEVSRRTAELLATGIETAVDRIQRMETLALQEDVLETIQDMVYVLDEDRTVELVTEPLAERMGADPETLVGTHISEVVGEQRAAALDREVRRRLRDGDADVVTAEVDLPGPDGAAPVEVAASLLPGEEFRGTVGVVRDRSEIAATRAELDVQRDRARHLLENLPDPVVEVEFTGDRSRIIGANDVFAEVFAASDPEDLVGTDVDDVVAPADRHVTVDPGDLDGALRDGQVVTETVRRRTAEGLRDFLFRGIPFETDEGRRAFGLYTDITDQKHRQRRLEVLNRVLRHNFRNRMTVVRGYADVIADRLSEADDDLRRAVEELTAGIEDVVGINRQVREIEAAFKSDDDVDHDAVPIVESVAERYRAEGADVETDLPESLATTTGEGLRLAVEQLVDNAVEHADAAAVVVDGHRRDSGMVALRVHDDGPGIPEHERAVVTGEREITQLDHGSGLGLWTVKWVAEAAGGGVEIDTDDGTTVTLLLPGSDADGQVGAATGGSTADD